MKMAICSGLRSVVRIERRASFESADHRHNRSDDGYERTNRVLHEIEGHLSVNAPQRRQKRVYGHRMGEGMAEMGALVCSIASPTVGNTSEGPVLRHKLLRGHNWAGFGAADGLLPIGRLPYF